MTDPGWALQKAIYGVLTSDANTLAALSGPHIYDHVPRKTAKPYVTFGQTVQRDWTTGTEEGSEHTLTLQVWAPATGAKKTAAVIEALRAALHDRAMALDGHHLVNLRHEFSEVRRVDDGETINGIARFRAVTEPD